MLNLLLPTTSIMALLPSPPLQMQRAYTHSTRLSIPAAAEDDRAPAVLRLALQGTPVAAALAVGTPLFALLYVPLAVLGRAAEAPPAATLASATLLYAACATLSDGNAAGIQPLLETVAISLICSAGLLAIGEDAEAEVLQSETQVTPLVSFYAVQLELNSRISRSNGIHKDENIAPYYIVAPHYVETP
jgi:hypothetical protein